MLATATDLRRVGLTRALRAIYCERGQMTRALLARRLGCTRATAGALVADLSALGLVAEVESPPTGHRGRPSPAVVPAPGGPMLVTAEIAVDEVRVATSALGQRPVTLRSQRLHSADADEVMATARAMLRSCLDELGVRCAGVGVSIYGLVELPSQTLAASPNLGWKHLDVRTALALPADVASVVDNVAHLAAFADARLGAGAKAATVLYLHGGIGIGGTLVLNGEPLRGRRGLAGEYGHLPLGAQGLSCRCGGTGCWETEVDQRALLRAAGKKVRLSRVAATAQTILERGSSEPHAQHAIQQTALALGRGIGALVNAHDPDMVVFAGYLADLLAAAPDAIRAGLNATALGVHRSDPPEFSSTAFGVDGGLVGGAEMLLSQLVNDPIALATHVDGGR